MADANAILQAIVQLLNGSGVPGSPQLNPYSANMNPANTGSLQTGLLNQLLGGVFPGLQPQAPPNLLLSDFQEMQRRDQLRSRTQDQFYLSPTLTRMLQNFGIQENQLRGPGNQLNFTGNVVASLYNNTLGRVIQDPYMQRAQVANQMRDVYSGVFFGRPRGQGGFGLTEQEVEAQTARLFGRAQGGSIFSREGFSAPEMFQVQRLGAERGLFMGANVGDIQRRTEQLAKTIKMGQAVFQTMDKEGVLEALQDLTQGQIPLSDTGSLNRVMFRVASMARAANTSVQVMSRLAAEGAQIFRQVDIGGTAGARTFMESARMTELFTSSMGPNLGAPISAQAVARAGGRRAVSALFQQQDVGQFGSAYFQNNAFLLEQLRQSGGAGMNINQLEQQFTQGELTRGTQVGMLQAFARDRDVSMGTARAMMAAGRGPAAERRLMERDPFEAMMTAQRARLQTLLRVVSPGMRKEFQGDRLNKESRRENRRAILMQSIGYFQPELSTAQRGVLADRMLETAVAEMQDPSSIGRQRFERFKKTYTRDVHNRRRTAVAMESMERQRDHRGFLAKVFSGATVGLGGEISASAFMESFGTELEGMGFGATEIRRRVLSEDPNTQVVPISEQTTREFLATNIAAAQFTKAGGRKGAELYSILSGMSGKALLDPSEAGQTVRDVKDIIKRSTDAVLAGTSEKDRQLALDMVDRKGFSIASMNEIREKTDLSRAQVAKLVRQERKAHFDHMQRSITTIEEDLGEGGLFESIQEAQMANPEYARLIEDIQKPDYKLTDDDRKILRKATGRSFDSVKDAQKFFVKQQRQAKKQQKDQLTYKGKVAKARLKDPNLAVDVAKEAMSFIKLGRGDLSDLMEDPAFEGEEEDLKLVRENQKRIREAFLEGGLGAGADILTQVMGEQVSPEQLGKLAATIVPADKLAQLKTGIRGAEGKELKLGQLQAAQKAGLFDAERRKLSLMEKQTEALSSIEKLLAKAVSGNGDGAGGALTAVAEGAASVLPSGPGVTVSPAMQLLRALKSMIT